MPTAQRSKFNQITYTCSSFGERHLGRAILASPLSFVPEDLQLASWACAEILQANTDFPALRQ